MRARIWVFLILLLGVGMLGGYWAGSRPEVPPLPTPSLTSQPANADPATPVPPMPPGLSEDERNTVEVYERAASAVVNVTTHTVEWSRFYGPVPVEGSGSGFIVNQEGHIVTNFHVVADAREVQVTLADGRSFDAKIVGADRLTDLAVLKIESEEGTLPTLPLGSSENLRVGQKVLAIGNPFGFQGTLTTGVISALERSIQTESGALLDEAIQTDAAINRGNSGGPLLDSQGRVIGVNTIIISPTGGNIGIGFAIPVSTLEPILNDLIRFGRVRRAWLGISGLDLVPALARRLRLPVMQGVLVVEAVPRGPADRAGLRGGDRIVIVGRYRLRVGGDIIVAVNGHEVKSSLDITRILYRKRPGDRVEVTFYRGGERRTVEVVLAERPAPRKTISAWPLREGRTSGG
ncbi:MAG: S1C family serine protease [Terriglobia bacterium]